MNEETDVKQKAGEIPLRERLSLADEWASYAADVMPANAPEVQRVETRRAFYAGAGAMFGCMTGGLDANHEPTDLDVAYIESIHQELKQFSRDIAKGTA